MAPDRPAVCEEGSQLSPATRSWHSRTIRQRICELLDHQPTLARIARVSHDSFSTAIPVLWQRQEAFGLYQNRIENVVDPTRYMAYRQAVKYLSNDVDYALGPCGLAPVIAHLPNLSSMRVREAEGWIANFRWCNVPRPGRNVIEDVVCTVEGDKVLLGYHEVRDADRLDRVRGMLPGRPDMRIVFKQLRISKLEQLHELLAILSDPRNAVLSCRSLRLGCHSSDKLIPDALHGIVDSGRFDKVHVTSGGVFQTTMARPLQPISLSSAFDVVSHSGILAIEGILGEVALVLNSLSDVADLLVSAKRSGVGYRSFHFACPYPDVACQSTIERLETPDFDDSNDFHPSRGLIVDRPRICLHLFESAEDASATSAQHDRALLDLKWVRRLARVCLYAGGASVVCTIKVVDRMDPEDCSASRSTWRATSRFHTELVQGTIATIVETTRACRNPGWRRLEKQQQQE